MKKGKLKQDKLDARMALLTTTLAYADLADADMVIEAVFEDMAVKQSVFEQLDAVMKPGAILATNTSTLDVDRIAAFTKRPQDVIGTHFFSPANVMKLLEVVRGRATAKDVLATVMALGKSIRKTCVVSGVCDGFIGNRMIEQYIRQAGFLLDEGATPQQVDRALEKFGMAMGPFRMGDLAGNDVGWYIRKRRYVEQPDMRYSRSSPTCICETRPVRPEDGAAWFLRLRSRAGAMRLPDADRRCSWSSESPRGELGVDATQDRRRRDRAPARLLALVNEGGEASSRRASRCAQVRHRRDLPDRLRVPAASAAGRCCYADTDGPLQRRGRPMMRQFAANPHGDPDVLGHRHR